MSNATLLAVQRVSKTLFRLARQEILRQVALRARTDHSLLGYYLIIAPHPDDEILGCGGLIGNAVAQGKVVKVIILTGGGGAHWGCCDIDGAVIVGKRWELAIDALRHLGLAKHHITFLDWEDGGLPQKEDLDFDAKVVELSALLTEMQPDHIFCPHPFEGWSDHVATEEITREAIALSRLNAALYHYCVWFWYSMPLRKAFRCDWRNALTLDISKVYRRKQAAISAYMAPCAPCGNPWSGKLPKEFMRAFLWKKELFFKFVV